MKNNEKGFIVPALITVIALLVIGGGVYIYESKKTVSPVNSDVQTQPSNQDQQTPEQNNPANSPAQTNMTTWKTFTDTEYGFSFKYPSNLHVNKSGYGGGNGWWFITQEKTAPAFEHDDSCGTSKAYMNVIATKDFTASGMNTSADQQIRVVEYNFKNSGGKKVSDQTIDGVRTVKFEGRLIDGVIYQYHVMIFKGKNNVDFSYAQCGGGIMPFNEIASTFKFISSAQSDITVLSPNGGESLSSGGTVVIKYDITGSIPQGSKVYLYLDGKDEIGVVNSKVSNYFSWRIGCFSGGDACATLTGQHKIQARLYNGQQLIAQDDSDNFFNVSLKYSQPVNN